MSITTETRAEGYEFAKTKQAIRAEIILEILDDGPKTASEIVKELLDRGIVKYYNRNFVAPRLTELKEEGRVEVIGKRPCIMSGKNVAVWQRVEVEQLKMKIKQGAQK